MNNETSTPRVQQNEDGSIENIPNNPWESIAEAGQDAPERDIAGYEGGAFPDLNAIRDKAIADKERGVALVVPEKEANDDTDPHLASIRKAIAEARSADEEATQD